MGKVDLPNLQKKDGRLYYRRKVAGKDFYIRLPGISDPNFAAAYARADQPEAVRDKPVTGTIAALVREFTASAEYRSIPSAKTRANYARYLSIIGSDHGREAVRALSHADVRRLRDRFADTPGKANNWLNVMRRLMAFAVEREYRRENPARDIKPLPIGERQPWPSDVLEAALAKASPMTRLAIITGLCSGARIGDVIRMQHGWHDGDVMQFEASKNKVDVAVPMHPLWLAELAKVPRRSVTLLYDRYDRPFSTTSALQERIRDLLKSVGATGYSFHGLRKNAACYLAELGLSDGEIGAIVAMTPQTVRHYTKRKRTLMIAHGAADRVKRGDVLPIKAGRSIRGAE